MRRLPALLGWIGIAGALAGCRTPTSITLSITTDVRCADLKGISITAGNSGSFETASPVTTTTNCTAISPTVSRIGTLVVVPSGGNDELAIRVVAGIDRPVEECTAASEYKGCVVARRVIRFQAHVELTLPIELHLNCKSVACDATSTCVAAGCKSATVKDPGCVGDGCFVPVDDASTDTSIDANVDANPDVAPDTTVLGDAGDVGSETCPSGTKSCGGKCVSINDPNYGCGAATCDKSGCPASGTLVCSGGACVVGSCGSGTKLCASSCVPTDATNGCADPARCTACASGESCTGAPTRCACVPEARATTCAKVACGVTTNNCGTSVDCGNTCTPPKSCGGGGAANTCGCTAPSPCNNVDCGNVTNACGVVVVCGCAGSDTCSGTPGKCGCVAPEDACALAGQSCGLTTDSCGKIIGCGVCSGSRVCRADCGYMCLLPGALCPL